MKNCKIFILLIFAIFLFSGCTKDESLQIILKNDDEVIKIISVEKNEDYPLPDVFKDGYDFDGWFFDKNFQNECKEIDTVFMYMEEITLFAKWIPKIYYVTFETSEKNEQVSPIEAEYGSEITLPIIQNRVGYCFAGWNTKPDGTGENYEINEKFVIPSNGTVLYAKWQINQYTVTFDSKNGSAVEPITQEYGTIVTAPQNPTRIGYNFVGWYEDEEFIDEYIFTVMPNENTTLYAKWQINQYTVIFDTKSGSAIEPITQDYGSEIILSEIPNYIGYSFIGWNAEADGTGENFGINEKFVIPSNGTVLYAKWQVNQYTVTFDSKNGSAVEPITLDYGTNIAVPQNPNREGYDFDGWYQDEALTIECIFDKMPNNDITVYAKWKAVVYLIEYNLNGGKNHFENPINFTVETKNLIIKAPTKSGYTFSGWFYDNNFEENAPIIINSDLTRNIILYAKWENRNINQIVINNLPNKIYYLSGEGLNTNGLKIELLFDNGESEIIDAFNNDLIEICGFNSQNIGSQNLFAKYGEFESNNFEVLVVDRIAQNISITKYPNKCDYIEGQEVDLIGGEILINYDNGLSEIISMNDKAVSAVYDFSVCGQQIPVTITYTYVDSINNAFSDTFFVCVNQKEILYIDLYGNPKTDYIEGQEFDTNFAKIKILYNNGTYELVDIKQEYLSGYDMNDIGEQTVTVTYCNKTTQLNITITAKSLSNIEAIDYIKEYLYGEEFDIGTGFLKLYYDNGTFSEISLFDENVIFDYNSYISGNQTVTIKYLGKETSISVFVKEKEIIDIGIQFELTESGYKVIGITKTDLTVVIIPQYYEGMPVTAIDGDAICLRIGELIIPPTIIFIEEYAFKNCHGTTIIFQARTDPLTIGENPFVGIQAKIIFNFDLTLLSSYDTLYMDLNDYYLNNDEDFIYLLCLGFQYLYRIEDGLGIYYNEEDLIAN